MLILLTTARAGGVPASFYSPRYQTPGVFGLRSFLSSRNYGFRFSTIINLLVIYSLLLTLLPHQAWQGQFASVEQPVSAAPTQIYNPANPFIPTALMHQLALIKGPGATALPKPLPGISQLEARWTQPGEGVVYWQTDQLDSQQYVEFGSDTVYGQVVKAEAIRSFPMETGGWQHEATLTSPLPGATHYRVVAGNSVSPDSQFSTPAGNGNENSAIMSANLLSAAPTGGYAINTISGSPGISGTTDSPVTYKAIRNLAISPDNTFALTIDTGGGVGCVVRKVNLVKFTAITYGGILDTYGKLGECQKQLGTQTKDAARFDHVSGIAISPDGKTALVVEEFRCGVRKIDLASGQVSTLAATGASNATTCTDPGGTTATTSAFFVAPLDLTFMPNNGNLALIVDAASHTIYELNLSTQMVTLKFGAYYVAGHTDSPGTAARFRTPRAISIERTGKYALLAEYGNCAVRYLNLEPGNFSVKTVTQGCSTDPLYGLPFKNPTGIAISSADNLALMTSNQEHLIWHLDLDNLANILANNQKIKPTAVAGSGTAGYKNGTGSAAVLNTPTSIKINPGGSLGLFYDWGNYVIRGVLIKAEEAPQEPPKSGAGLPPFGAEPGQRCECANAGDPVNLASGEFYFNLPLLSHNGKGLPINFELSYATFNSLKTNFSRFPMPVGWSHSYARSLKIDSANSNATLYTEDGRMMVYTYNATSGQYTAPTGSYATLAKDTSLTPAGYKLTYRNGSYDTYNDKGLLVAVTNQQNLKTVLSYDTSSRLVSLKNPLNSYYVLLYYDGNGRLSNIRENAPNQPTTINRSVSIQYDSYGRVSRLTDSMGLVLRAFEYDTTSQTAPIARFYDGNNDPATVTSPKYTRNQYDSQGRVLTQTLASGVTINFDRTATADYNLQVFYNQAVVERYLLDSSGKVVRQYNRDVADPSLALPAYAFFRYDTMGNQATYTDQVGQRIDYKYDAKGNLIAIWQHTVTGGYSTDCSTNCNKTTMTYNTAGLLSGKTEPMQETTLWSYYTDGLLSSQTRKWPNDSTKDLVTTYMYDENRQLSKIIHPRGNQDTFTYDTMGYPAETILDAGGAAVKSTNIYHPNGMLFKTTDGAGVVTDYQYLLNGRLDSFTTGGVKTAFEYDKVGNVVKTIQNAGAADTSLKASTIMTYSPKGAKNEYKVMAIQDAEGAIKAFDYNSSGQLVWFKDQMTQGNATWSAYTVQGWLSATILPDGRVIRYEYKNNGQLTKQTDARGGQTLFTYDGAGRLSRKVEGAAAVGSNQALALTTNYTYDANNRVKAVKDPSDRSKTMAYDAFGRVALVSDGLNNYTEYLYDKDVMSRETMGTNLNGTVGIPIVTYFTYDGLGRILTKVTNKDSATSLKTSYVYSRPDTTDRLNLQQVTDPNGYTTQYKYNSLGKLSQLTDAHTNNWYYSYNNLGYLTSQRDPISPSRNITYTVDKLGRTNELIQDGRKESWAYNTDDTLSTHTDFMGQRTHYQYDLTKRLTWVATSAAGTGSIPVPGISYKYDAANNLIEMKDGDTTADITTYTYDAANRLTSRVRNNLGVSYGYNKNDLDNLTAKNGLISYKYDGAGRISSIKPNGDYGGSDPFTYSYNSNGSLASQSRLLDVATSLKLKTDYSYDQAGRLINQKHYKTDAAATKILDLAYTYDANGNVASLKDTYGTSSFVYDKLNRLISHSLPALPGGTGSVTEWIGYDGVGNRKSAAGATYTYDNSDRLTSPGFSYDANGSLLSDGSTTYAYDVLNRLNKTVKGGVTTVYKYDGKGNLVQKTVTQGSTVTKTEYLWDERGSLPRLLGEISNGKELYYIYGPEGVTAQVKYQAGSVATLEAYPILDQQGSVRQLVAANSSTTVLLNQGYDPFGRVRFSNGSGQTSLGYTGEYQEKENNSGGTGLVFLRTRMYQPGLGRFLQRDSFAGFLPDPQSLHRYAYVENNPMTHNDPSGHSWYLSPGKVKQLIFQLSQAAEEYQSYINDINAWSGMISAPAILKEGVANTLKFFTNAKSLATAWFGQFAGPLVGGAFVSGCGGVAVLEYFYNKELTVLKMFIDALKSVQNNVGVGIALGREPNSPIGDFFGGNVLLHVVNMENGDNYAYNPNSKGWFGGTTFKYLFNGRDLFNSSPHVRGLQLGERPHTDIPNWWIHKHFGNDNAYIPEHTTTIPLVRG